MISPLFVCRRASGIYTLYRRPEKDALTVSISFLSWRCSILLFLRDPSLSAPQGLTQLFVLARRLLRDHFP